MNDSARAAGVESHDLRNVIATSDLTDESDAALRTAACLAAAEQTRLHLFHCVPRPVLPYWKDMVDAGTSESWLRNAGTQLERQKGRVLTGEDPTAEITVAFGSPSIEIGRFARDVSASVIVLGPHRPRVAFDDLLGTTADRVLRTSERPCLLAHRPLTAPPATVLVGTDFSPRARHALELIVDWLAGPLGHPSPDLVIVEILHISAFASLRIKPRSVQSLLRQEAEAARRRLSGPTPITIRSRILSAALESEGIASACEQINPDLVVLGTHGYGFLSRALLGSTASTVARTVRHPLLLVPGASGPG